MAGPDDPIDFDWQQVAGTLEVSFTSEGELMALVLAPLATLAAAGAETLRGTGAVIAPAASLFGSEQPVAFGEGAVTAPPATLSGAGEVSTLVPPSTGGVFGRPTQTFRVPRRLRKRQAEAVSAVARMTGPAGALAGRGLVMVKVVVGRARIRSAPSVLHGLAFNDELADYHVRQRVIEAENAALMADLLTR